jgi:UDP-N-acetylglucosamine--N-acetylmuramyl-(pentapeptide) pyrophosphoryl-undecaprenol N-acetylglucosamine transferase
MPAAIAEADLVVGRSGASAVSEICAVGRPSILIPYPYAAGDHQRVNAQVLEREGAAICVRSEQANAEYLKQVLETIAGDPSRLARMAEAARQIGKPAAAETIARDLLKLAGHGLASAATVAVSAGLTSGGWV